MVVGWAGQALSSDAQSSYALGQASCLDHAVVCEQKPFFVQITLEGCAVSLCVALDF